MTPAKYCSECGTPLPGPDSPCPGCLLRLGERPPEPAAPARPGAGPIPAIEELQPLFPNLQLLEFVGRGGMGFVYKARQRDLDRYVALKVLPAECAADPAFAERFEREARVLGKLDHSHIVRVFDAGQSGGRYWITMEFVDGANLRQAIQAEPLAPKQALEVVSQICEALEYAHGEGIIHRDIKPENILLDQRGRVKIADFGLAKLLKTDGESVTLTRSDQALGTPHYMAPEQIRRPLEVDHRADLYSLGVVLYELLTGELPMGHFPLPSDKGEVDARLDEVVLRTLEREPERRYQAASDLEADVRHISSTEADAGPAGRRARPSSPKEAVQYARALVDEKFAKVEERMERLHGPDGPQAKLSVSRVPKSKRHEEKRAARSVQRAERRAAKEQRRAARHGLAQPGVEDVDGVQAVGARKSRSSGSGMIIAALSCLGVLLVATVGIALTFFLWAAPERDFAHEIGPQPVPAGRASASLKDWPLVDVALGPTTDEPAVVEALALEHSDLLARYEALERAHRTIRVAPSGDALAVVLHPFAAHAEMEQELRDALRRSTGGRRLQSKEVEELVGLALPYGRHYWEVELSRDEDRLWTSQWRSRTTAESNGTVVSPKHTGARLLPRLGRFGALLTDEASAHGSSSDYLKARRVDWRFVDAAVGPTVAAPEFVALLEAADNDLLVRYEAVERLHREIRISPAGDALQLVIRPFDERATLEPELRELLAESLDGDEVDRWVRWALPFGDFTVVAELRRSGDRWLYEESYGESRGDDGGVRAYGRREGDAAPSGVQRFTALLDADASEPNTPGVFRPEESASGE